MPVMHPRRTENFLLASKAQAARLCRLSAGLARLAAMRAGALTLLREINAEIEKHQKLLRRLK